MNIAIFASAYHPSLGGVEEVVRQLVHQQSLRGDRPLIFTNRWPKDLPAIDEYEGTPLHRYVFRVPDQSARQVGGALLYGLPTIRSICADLRKHQAELINVHCVSSNAHYALLAKRRLKLPLVVTLHGELTMDATRLFERSKFAANLMRRSLAAADAITAVSKHTLAEAEAFFGQPFGERARVIYNGIRLDDFRGVEPFQRERPYILAIGRHVHQKGFDVLLQAFALAIQQGEETHDLLLAGDGVMRTRLEALAADLKLTGRVHFTGRVDRIEAVRLFTGCSFFVLPSRHEPLGIVNLEAMAAGKAIIATKVGGVPEMVQEGQTGLLVPGSDVRFLCAAIQRLVGDRALRDRLGQAGKERAQAFDWSVIAEQYASLYNYACTAAGKRSVVRTTAKAL